MGNFQSARKVYKSLARGSDDVPTLDLYVIPKSRSASSVQITMTSMAAGSEPRTVKSTDVETADIWEYYSVHIPVPAPGVWKLDVRAGKDSGCFQVTFKK